MTRRYRVEGRVQGVGFRYFTKREGRRIGVTGWVRNREDGGVEVLAYGSAGQLEDFEQVLRQGPRSASVTNLHILENIDEVSLDITFEIR